MRIVAYLLRRFSEPSSYAGLGALLALLGWNLPESDLSQLVQGLAAVCALLALGLKDRGVVPAIMLVATVGPMFLA
jgi:sulfite exporter TauE/SafE